MPEIIVILVIIMLLFGPSQLPKLARGLGNDEIRHHLRLSSRQLHRRRKAVYKLLGAFDKNMAMTLAARLVPYGHGDDLES